MRKALLLVKAGSWELRRLQLLLIRTPARKRRASLPQIFTEKAALSLGESAEWEKATYGSFRGGRKHLIISPNVLVSNAADNWGIFQSCSVAKIDLWREMAIKRVVLLYCFLISFYLALLATIGGVIKRSLNNKGAFWWYNDPLLKAFYQRIFPGFLLLFETCRVKKVRRKNDILR